MPASRRTNKTDMVPVIPGSETFKDAAGIAKNIYAIKRIRSCDTHKDKPRTKQTAPPAITSVMYALADSDIVKLPSPECAVRY
jgi:hypothetical protein